MGETAVESRRRFLSRALGLGALAGGLGWRAGASAQSLGRSPRQLPEGQSVFQVSGPVTVDGKPATRETVIGQNAVIETGQRGSLVAVVGDEAFALRGGSRLEMRAARGAKRFFRLVTGAMLAVFPDKDDLESDDTPVEREIHTPVAVIGIRGTGVYTEARPDLAYFCTCYGTTRIASLAQPDATETITSIHHDAPRYVLADPQGGKVIVPAPFINHTDIELMTLEALVGREVPFGLADQDYGGPARRRY